MSILQVSDTQLNYDGKEMIKTIRLKNESTNGQLARPVMFKIKTNKIDLVDAKPSCGYISGMKESNQISVSIRVLKNKQFNAKLQILYIHHDEITQGIVEKNKTHFDINQYNDYYEKIKKTGQRDAKCIYVLVQKKIDNSQTQSVNCLYSYDKNQAKQNHNDKNFSSMLGQSKEKVQKSQIKTRSQSFPKQDLKKYQKIEKTPQNIAMSQKRFIQTLLIVFLLGTVFGFYLKTKLSAPTQKNIQSYHQDFQEYQCVEGQQCIIRNEIKKYTHPHQPQIKITVNSQQQINPDPKHRFEKQGVKRIDQNVEEIISQPNQKEENIEDVEYQESI